MFKARHSQTCPGKLVSCCGGGEAGRGGREEEQTFTRKRGSQHYPSGQAERCSPDTGWLDWQKCVGTPEPGKLVMGDLEEKGTRVEPGAASVGDSG